MVNTEGCPPGHAAHPLGAQGPGPPASALCQVGVGGCRAGGHSAARAQDPRRRPGCWGELGPRPPSTQSTHRPPCRAPKGHGGFREHGREDPVCHGELWQPCLWTVAARDHQTLPDAKAPAVPSRRHPPPQFMVPLGERLPQLTATQGCLPALGPRCFSHSMLALTPEPAPVQ